MWDFIKLTLSSNGKPTMIRVNSIVQMYEDTTMEGEEYTRIDFECNSTKVKENIGTIMTLIRNTRLNSIYGLTGAFTHARVYEDTDSIKDEKEGDES